MTAFIILIFNMWYNNTVKAVTIMLWNAEDKEIEINGEKTYYISFGNGNKPLIIIPGLGDGLKDVRGIAIPMAYRYRDFAKEYKVYVLSRKNNLPSSYSTRQMAEDIYNIMSELKIDKAHILGISMGGMIAQFLAIDHPECIDKLILAVTLSKPNNVCLNLLDRWIKLANNNDYESLMFDSAVNSYSYRYLWKNRTLLYLSTQIGDPHDFSRFITLANACRTHNAYNELYKIKCPVLIIGGKNDKIVTGCASYEIAEKIHGCKLLMHNKYGHALYDEADDFSKKIIEFLKD